MELTPGLFRSLHPGIQAYRLISANQYYILWHTLNKMNNDLQFIVRYHPWRAAAKHTGIIKYFADIPLSTCARIILTKRPLCGRPLRGWLVTPNGLALALNLFAMVHSDSFYAHLISFSAVLCS